MIVLSEGLKDDVPFKVEPRSVDARLLSAETFSGAITVGWVGFVCATPSSSRRNEGTKNDVIGNASSATKVHANSRCRTAARAEFVAQTLISPRARTKVVFRIIVNAGEPAINSKVSDRFRITIASFPS